MNSNLRSAEELANEYANIRERLLEAEATIEAIRSGEVDAVVVYSSPVEEVYTLEGADRPYRLLVEAMEQAVATLNREGKVLYCNPSFAKMLRLPVDSVIGASVSSLFLHDDSRAWEVLLARALKGNCDEEIHIHLCDGSETHVQFRLACLPFLGTMCLLLTDLTQQKQYEELVLAREQLRLADRKKDEFLATLAHELRNPMAPLRNSIDVLKSDTADPEQIEQAKNVIDRQVQQMTRLLNDILDISRVTQNQWSISLESVDLSEIIESAVEAGAPELQRRNQKLGIELPSTQIRLAADPVRLTQVFLNLLNNASKYTPEGGEVNLRAREDDGQAIITVEDTGVGIEAEQLSKVFDMFTQVNRTTDKNQGGLGIGLALVRAVVELHGGRVEARSAGRGQGSVFEVQLPITQVSELPDEVAPPTDLQDLRMGTRILIVDDLKDSADSLAPLLSLYGLDVEVAYDGDEAIHKAKEFQPEVMLVDIGLPGKNGYQVAQAIRALPEGKGILLVAVTGWGQEEDVRLAREAGFDHHMVKPAESTKILEFIATHKQPTHS